MVRLFARFPLPAGAGWAVRRHARNVRCRVADRSVSYVQLRLRSRHGPYAGDYSMINFMQALCNCAAEPERYGRDDGPGTFRALVPWLAALRGSNEFTGKFLSQLPREIADVLAERPVPRYRRYVCVGGPSNKRRALDRD